VLAPLPVGILGAWARSGPEALAIAIEGFGAIALAYLVTEALLREAHNAEERSWIAAIFFAGSIPLFMTAVIVGR
jgi:ZIP family zinc transporter